MMYRFDMKQKTFRTCCGMEIEVETLDRLAQVLKLLAHADRLAIVGLLDKLGPTPVHRVVSELELPQNAVSQHLNQMKRVGLVAAERRGKEVWYRVGDDSALAVLGCLRKKGALK
jgi:ArsR family transcriptional regulator, zinc-responsive transcriptional repressor